MYVTLSAALMALTLVRASAMMAELDPVPLGPRLAVECAEHAIIFVSCGSCGDNQPATRDFLKMPPRPSSADGRLQLAARPDDNDDDDDDAPQTAAPE